MSEITEQRIKDWVEFRLTYPTLNRGEIASIFPDWRELESHPQSLRLMAKLKMDQQDEIKRRKDLNQNDCITHEMIHKVQIGAQKAIDVLVASVDSEDQKTKQWAVNRLTDLNKLDAYFAKFRELQAEFDGSNRKSDESYPEPSGSEESME